MNERPENLQAEELNLDELEIATGGAELGREISGDGTVTAALGNGKYSVDIGGQTVTAYASGKMRIILIQPGDRVQVEGNRFICRITWRYK